MSKIQIPIPYDDIRAFCEKWQIIEFALFGSVLREDFGPESDIDVMVYYPPNTTIDLLDEVQMVYELREIFGRKVDMVSKKAIQNSQNSARRNAILNSAQVVHVA